MSTDYAVKIRPDSVRAALIFYAEASRVQREKDAGYMADAALRGRDFETVMLYVDRDFDGLAARIRRLVAEERSS